MFIRVKYFGTEDEAKKSVPLDRLAEDCCLFVISMFSQVFVEYAADISHKHAPGFSDDKAVGRFSEYAFCPHLVERCIGHSITEYIECVEGDGTITCKLQNDLANHDILFRIFMALEHCELVVANSLCVLFYYFKVLSVRVFGVADGGRSQPDKEFGVGGRVSHEIPVERSLPLGVEQRVVWQREVIHAYILIAVVLQ